MIRNIIVIAILILCTIRTISFALFTQKEKNTVGAISLYTLVVFFWVVNVIFLF